MFGPLLGLSKNYKKTMDKSFLYAPVEVPRLSGFDKSFQNLLTSKCGTITPILFDEVMPGSIIDLDLALSASLPPLASETFMRCSVKVEAFLVPMRLLYGGFEHFFTGDEFDIVSGDDIVKKTVTRLPHFVIGTTIYDSETAEENGNVTSSADLVNWFGTGSLADYLGFRVDAKDETYNIGVVVPSFNVLPWLCYHLVWDSWYRSTLIQKSCFAPLDHNKSFDNSSHQASMLPYVTLYSNFDRFYIEADSSPAYFAELVDGVSIFSLRQRNFGFDYFTTATPSPQNGDPAKVTLDGTSLATLAGGFTISQLRTMNALQQFRERNNLAGDRYVDRLYSQYGVRPSDGIAQRPLCIGTDEFEVYSKGIYQNDNGDTTNNNPFAGQVGARYGTAYASGTTKLCKGLKVSEPCYLLVNATLVPRVTYSLGINKLFKRYCDNNSIGEMANPILQSVGPEPIYSYELSNDWIDGTPDVFGYTDRYGSFKNRFDELHGLVRDGQSLESFALQRYIDAAVDAYIDTDFLEIPTDYMDNVTAVKQTISDYGVWMDCFFKYHVSMPLSKYSLPTLQDPAYEHGKTLVVRRGGFRF